MPNFTHACPKCNDKSCSAPSTYQGTQLILCTKCLTQYVIQWKSKTSVKVGIIKFKENKNE